ncbi:MAG: amidohydrolase [Proteobacteria bacterium]|nr:amidohydrolase [Pseudomonadota bacterium]
MKCMPAGLCVLLAAVWATAAAAAPIEHEQLQQLVSAELPSVIAWRRDIHQHPELGNRETRTAALVAAHLRKLGLKVETGVAHTGVVALLQGGLPGKTVAVRADMDALPVTEKTDVPFRSHVTTSYRGETVGVMHACGHDTHTAMLMGLAEELTRMRERLPGQVLFIFQPAEEGAPAGEEGGAQLMLKEGLFERYRPQAVFGMHVWSGMNVGEIGYRAGPLLAAADTFTLRVQGRQSHGSQPWHSVDPIVTAAQIITALQTVVSRNVNLTENPAVVSVGAIRGGNRSNIIPSQVEMQGTVRTYSDAQREQVLTAIRRIASHTGEANGATATVEFEDPHYPVTYNDPKLTAQALPSLRLAAGAAQVREVPLVTASEDFSFFARKVPGFFFFVGVTPKGQDADAAPTNHSDYFYVDESGLAVGLAAMTQVVVDYLQGS